ncbi:MAG TPA: hypothetical protein VFW23_01665 [Tepidisphaeraceae bacterium]|nr:hypothetical protein [Tepidisphaeraceae bacterium]
MTMFSWTWWTRSTQGLLARIAIGAAIFAILATVDLVRHGKKATRWREYLFLVAGVVLACGYGMINDQITSRISWEYFYYGKGLDDVLGSRIPPDSTAMSWAAMKVGIEATWTAGLIVSVALLIANNPGPNRPQLPYRTLLGHFGFIAIIAVGCSIILGTVGYLGSLTWISSDFRWLAHENLMRPSHFMCVFGIHLGAYLGGTLGVIVSVLRVVARRKRQGGNGIRSIQQPHKG